MTAQAADALMGVFGMKRVTRKPTQAEWDAMPGDTFQGYVDQVNARLNARECPLCTEELCGDACSDCYDDDPGSIHGTRWPDGADNPDDRHLAAEYLAEQGFKRGEW